MKIVWLLTKKELNNYLNSPLGYIVIAPFLAFSYFLYFRTSFVSGLANLRPFFELLPWFFVILAPALTMSLLSEEKVRKTGELLLAHPISFLKVVLAKFVAAQLFFGLILLLTVPLTFPIWLFSTPDWGLIFSQYLGALFLSAVFLAAGLLASSLTVSLVSSFILGVIFNFNFILLGLELVTLALPAALGHLLVNLSILGHVESVAKGLLDISDLSYFFILTSLLLLATVFNISREKLSENKKESKKLWLAFILILVCGSLTQLIFSKFPLRLDLTRDRLYSLSPATIKTIKEVDDLLTIKVFASRNLPPAAQNLLQSTLDTLSDYKNQNSKIKIERIYPEAGSKTGQEAESLGVQPLQFNTIGTASYELKEGYLGLSLRFKDKTDVLPYISETHSLEYQLTRRIIKMLNLNKNSLGFFNGPDQTEADPQHKQLRGQLEIQYLVKDLLNLDEKSLEEIDLLIVAGLQQPINQSQVKSLQKFTDSGRKLMLLLDKVVPQPGQEMATVQKTGLEDFLKTWSLTINDDLAIDPSLMETVQVSRGQQLFLLPYPFWLRSLPSKDSIVNTGISQVNVFWPSSINLENKESVTFQVLLKTSANGLSLTSNNGNFTIGPDKLGQLSLPTKSQELNLGVLAVDSKTNGQLALIADSELVADAYLSSQNQGLAYILNLVDFLVLGKDQSIPLKSGGQQFYVFNKAWQPAVTQWSLILAVPILTLAYGFTRLWRRRRGFSRNYSD